MVRHLNKVANDDTHSRELRLAALRKVMQEHTYAQRALCGVQSHGAGTAKRLPHIAVVALVANQAELDNILCQYQQQRYAPGSLLVVAANGMAPLPPMINPNIRIVPSTEITGQSLRIAVGGAQWVAAMA